MIQLGRHTDVFRACLTDVRTFCQSRKKVAHKQEILGYELVELHHVSLLVSKWYAVT